MTNTTDTAVAGGDTSRNINATLASLLADRWWTLVVRGLAALAFGIFALAAPRTTLLAIIYVWGAYALVDGVGALINAWRKEGAAGGRGWLVFEGLVGITVGVIAFAWTGVTAFALLMLIAAWALLTGISELVIAYRLRREIESEWLLSTSGLLSIIVGIALFLAPGAGLVALLWTIGIYAIVFGLMQIGLGARARSWKSGVPRAAAPPPEVIPTRA